MTIANKLEDLGFRLKSYAIGKHECTCPFCSSQRKAANKKKKVAMVWIEEQFASYNCVHCGEHGFVIDDVHRPIHYKRPEVKVKDNLGQKAESFFKNRGLSLSTAKKFGIYIETHKFSKPMIAYPYYKNGVLVNVKYRGIEEKCFAQEKDCEPIFYNYDNCFGKKEIIIVEGENDALAFAEVGYDNVVSIPAGSVSKAVGESSTKFDFIKNSQPLIESCERFILALDSDQAGQAMTQELINRLGRAKCSLVDWTVYDVEGKDANDFLKQDKSILKDAIEHAKPLPMKGIVHCSELFDDFEDYSLNGIKESITTGFHNLDKLINFQYGDFVTVTGYPGNGKSNFLTNMSMNFALSGFKILVYAFENTANQLFKKWFQMLLSRPTTNADEQTIVDMRGHYDFIDKHFLIYQDFESLRTIDEIIESAEQAVQQEGVKFVIIDPLNKIPYSKTDNVSNDLCVLLNKLTAFCKRNKVVTFLVAHPTKPEKGKLKNVDSPSGFDIAGSANFLNMSDVVLTVHRKQSDDGIKGNISKVMISKVRDTDYGHEGSCYFRYNTYTGQYTPCEKAEYDDERLEGVSNW